MVRGEVKSVDNESLSLMVVRFCWAQYTFISCIESAGPRPPTLHPLRSDTALVTVRQNQPIDTDTNIFGADQFWFTMTMRHNHNRNDVVWLENNSSDAPCFWIVLLGPGWRLGGYYSGRSWCWITLDRDILSTPLWMWPCHPVSVLSVNRAELCRYIYSRCVDISTLGV